MLFAKQDSNYFYFLFDQFAKFLLLFTTHTHTHDKTLTIHNPQFNIDIARNVFNSHNYIYKYIKNKQLYLPLVYGTI